MIVGSFAVLLFWRHVAFVWIGMTLLTVGEMLNFPYVNRFVYDRADHGKPGAYMSGFTITWSVAHIFGHTAGLNSIDWFGYEVTWAICAAMVFASIWLYRIGEKMMVREDIDADLPKPAVEAEETTPAMTDGQEMIAG